MSRRLGTPKSDEGGSETQAEAQHHGKGRARGGGNGKSARRTRNGRRIYNSMLRRDKSFGWRKKLDFVRNEKKNAEMKQSIVVGLLLIILTACSTAQSTDPVDENLSFNVPIPDKGWTVQSGKNRRQSMDIARWQKENEWFQTMIMHANRIGEPEQYRIAMDAYSKKNSISDFQSKILKQGLVNNYPMIFWQAGATLKDGTKTFELILYIQGKDATYQIVRRWDNTQVSDSDKQRWIDYMESISVCDNRYPEHQCQKQEQKLPGHYQAINTTNTVSQSPANITNTVTNN